MSENRSIVIAIIIAIGIVLSAWLISRWQPLGECTLIFDGNQVSGVTMENNK